MVTRVVVMALRVRFMESRVFALRLSHFAVVMVTLQTRSQSHRHRPGHHGARPYQDKRLAETGNIFATVAREPRPPGTHNDIALKQQNRDPGSLHRLGLTGVRAEGDTHGPGHDPQRSRSGIRR